MQKTPYTLSGFQVRNEEIYGIINSCGFDPLDMICRAQRFIECVLLAVQNKKTERVAYHLCMAFSWLCALSNKMSISMDMSETSVSPPFCLGEMQTACGAPITVEHGAIDLARALMSLAGALEYWRARHEPEFYHDSIEGLAVAFECLFRFASSINVNLADTLEETFSKGCPKCLKIPCGEFTTPKVV